MKLRSIYKQIFLLTVDRPFPLEKPKVVQFPVIDICNSRCQMCRIWEKKKSDDITVEELRVGLRNGLFSEVESIGFNGGEPTLRKDLPEVVKVVVDTLHNLRAVSLITNAFKHRQVIEQIEKMGLILKTKNISFDVMISLDGFEGVHDRVRGREGNFRNAQNVLNYINSSDLVDSVRIGCTVIRENVNDLSDLLDFCIKNDLYIKYRQGIPHQRLYTENLKDPYALNFEEKYEFVEFIEGLIEHYEPDPMQRFFYRSLADQIIKGAPRRAGCAWQYQGATITARGELAYCAVKSKVLSKNIAQGNPSDAYFDNESHLRSIISNDCNNCHHDYVGVPSKSDYRKLFLERLDQRFGVKRIVQGLPGFQFLNSIRMKKRFLNDLSHIRAIPRQIRIASAEGSPDDAARVLICGWYGTETLGDKAIIGGILNTFRKLLGDHTRFTVASLNLYITENTRRQMKEFDGVSVVDVEQAARIAETMNYLVFGGGPLMAINTLAPIEAIFERAKAAGVCTVASAVGVGPLGKSWLNKSIRRILDLCDIRIYRDEQSRLNAVVLGVPAQDDLVAEDPAFTWLSQVPWFSHSEEPSMDKVILLGLRDFPYREYASDLSEAEALVIKKNYEQVVIDTLKNLVAADKNLIIRPLPMCTNHFGSDDRWFYRRLFRDCDELRTKLDFSLLGPEKSPLKYTQAFEDADALLAMRFHSLVFGIGLGTNCVAIDYTMGKGKVKSLADNYHIPLIGMQELNTRQLLAELKAAINKPRPERVAPASLKFEAFLEHFIKVERL